jgi:hypothetical protein
VIESLCHTGIEPTACAGPPPSPGEAELSLPSTKNNPPRNARPERPTSTANTQLHLGACRRRTIETSQAGQGTNHHLPDCVWTQAPQVVGGLALTGCFRSDPRPPSAARSVPPARPCVRPPPGCLPLEIDYRVEMIDYH